MVGGGAARDDVERAVGERKRLRAADDVGAHARGGVARDDLEPRVAQPPRDVPAARRDVERGRRAGSPGDEPVEVLALAVRIRVDVRLRPVAPRPSTSRGQLHRGLRRLEHGRRHRRFGGAASARIRRPSSAFVPSSRTTIGSSSDISPSAWRIPRATSSQRVIPPKMLKKIAFTCGSFVITERASTTPWASPPPPRSQKFAGRPPANVTTSTVDIVRPGAVAEHADLAVELHVRDVLLARERLERVGGVAVAHLGDLRDDGRARCRRP